MRHAAVSERSSSQGPAVPWWYGWLPVVLLPGIVIAVVPERWPRWAFMWLLAMAIYASVKWLTWRRTPRPHVPPARHLGYLLAWPGLDAPRFLDSLRHPQSPTLSD